MHVDVRSGWSLQPGAISVSVGLVGVVALILGTVFRSPSTAVLFIATSLLVSALSDRLGWALALATNLVGVAAWLIFLAAVTPHLPWSLATSYLVSSVAWLATGGVLLWQRGLPHPAPETIRLMGPAAAVPVAALLAFVAWARVTATDGLIAAFMTVDSSLHAVWATNVWEDDGTHLGRHNVAPFTSVMNAVFASDRLRDLQRPDDSGEVLFGILQATHELQILLWCLVVFMASVIALRLARRGRSPLLLIVPGLTVAAALLSWFWLPQIGANGAMNMAPAAVLLMVVWIVWLTHERSVPTALVTLVLATVVGVTVWAPVAALPFSLFWAVAIRARAEIVHRPLRNLAPAAVTIAVSLAYLVAVTLPQMRETSRTYGNVLAFDGVIIPLPLSLTLVVLVALVGFAVTLRTSDRLTSTGLRVVVMTTMVIGAFLMWERRGADHLWGYYPIKFAWIVLSAVLLIALASAIGLALRLGDHWTVTTGAAAALSVVLLAVSPVYPRGEARLIAFPVSLSDPTVPVLSAFVRGTLTQHPVSMVYYYSGPLFPGEPARATLNDWYLTYYLWTTYATNLLNYPTDYPEAGNFLEPKWMCTFARALGPDLIVWTSSPEHAMAFREMCPGTYETRVVNPTKD